MAIRKPILWAVFFVCGVAVAVLAGAFLPVVGRRAWHIVSSASSPFIVMRALCAFLALYASDLVPRGTPTRLDILAERFAPLTMGIYLIHPFVLDLLAKVGIDGFLVSPLVGIPVTASLAFGLSLAAAWLIGLIPGIRRLVC